ncbi:Hypothetical predicted protein [Lecanosticta acicola]|uniref:AB hydrolase-1 domain-containing protein n=1 Tax=Lecanosticta acicola TaxID=111012 RepID=A0AAI8YPK9_9PEZI|nr:Hypothetical predicted protein [Lecanosticta acicola]
MAAERRDVEFKTVDGLTLRGWLFLGPKGGPAVVVNGAFNSPREIFVAAVAKWFGEHGVTALVYDARSLGLSDGLPRNDLDPQKITEDNHDAVTFLQDSGHVDPGKIAIWGFFYSSLIALEAAAFDPRVKAVISQGLMPEWTLDPAQQPSIIASAIQDRAAQLRGKPPTYIPLLNEAGDHMTHFTYLAALTPEQKTHLRAWVPAAQKIAPSFRPEMTLQSLYRHAKWRPLSLLQASGITTPVMVLTPENDEMVDPGYQKKIFDGFASGLKRYEVIPDVGHLDFLAKVEFDRLLGGQLEFLKEAMEF